MRSLFIGVGIALLSIALGFLFLRDVHLDDAELEKALKGKHVLICGASQGIGKELALEFSRRGVEELVISARNKEALDAVAELCRSTGKVKKVHVVVADLSSRDASLNLLNKAVELMGGKLDTVILNHIRSFFTTWDKVEDQGKILRATFEVNTFSYIEIATAALPFLEKADGGGGSIVAVSSVAGKMGIPRTSVYSASKHALHGFFDSLRNELVTKNSKVSITLCVLGSIASGEYDPSALNGVSVSSAKDTARAIVVATALKMRELYFPKQQTWPPTLLRIFIPDILDGFVRAAIPLN